MVKEKYWIKENKIIFWKLWNYHELKLALTSILYFQPRDWQNFVKKKGKRKIKKKIRNKNLLPIGSRVNSPHSVSGA